ncbi:hypothetical protein [Klebsiella phage vB_KshKPC-M]|nr:hypothetical protein [Klebsiella phage vB_KshKPC-M]
METKSKPMEHKQWPVPKKPSKPKKPPVPNRRRRLFSYKTLVHVQFAMAKITSMQVFEVPEDEIDRFRHEIFKGRVEFYDNPKRTREYIAAVAKAKEIVQPKSAEEQ